MMNRQLLKTLIAVLMLAFIEKSFSNAVDENSDLRTVSTAVNQFSTSLYGNIAEKFKKNLISSPLSVSIVLSMTSFGAGGLTEKEMHSSLRLPSNKTVSKKGFQSLIDSLNSMKKIDLRLANKVYTHDGFPAEPEFKKLTKDYFRSETESLDFRKADAASQTINAWCEKQTNNRIKDIVQADIVHDSSMILINAVYFKGQWKKKFHSALTTPKPFYTEENTSKKVPMMHATDLFNYGDLPELDAKFLELEYVKEDKNDSGATRMIIILPNTVKGLKKVESNLNKEDLTQLCKKGIKTKVILRLPKFKIESKIDLQSFLEKMGMTSMFTNSANFNRISKKERLKVSKVIQKAFIEVNEQGSEAAAVTFVGMARTMAIRPPPRPIVFNVNKPFMYAIVHGATNTILFEGHVKLPKS